MRCPKCGGLLEEIIFGDVRVDKCLSCEGIWLDRGEFETLQTKEPGFMARILSAFR
jgi:Zn-finger nucleic acid-binding protein